MSRPGRPSRRRARRRPASGFRITHVASGPELGEGVVAASLEELERAIRGQADDLDWDAVADQVIPVMPRIRPYPAGFPDPLRVVVDPGVAIGFAIDIGPGFMNVGIDLIRSWGVPLADVHTRSLVNLVARAARIETSSIVDGSLDGTPTRWLQTGQSIGSVMVLVPDVLRQVFGPEPAFFITPMRDLIIGLPADVARDLAARLWLEVASEDPNCLGPIGYRFDGQSIAPEALEPEVLGLGHDRQDRRAHLA